MRLPDEVQKCVVFFGLKKIDEKTGVECVQYGGTGFFISVHSTVPGATFAILVTAAHVAQRLEHGEFYIRANKKDGTAVEYRVDGGVDVVWHFHPTDESVDAAMAVWAPPFDDAVDYLCIGANMFLDPQEMERKRIGTGDEVYITGLFRALYGARRNLPIVRSGNLAMLPVDRVPVRDWRTPDVAGYLVESRSIGGASGSPVFVQRSIKVQAIEETGREPLAAGAIFWLGLVCGHWDERRVKSADEWGNKAIEVGLSVIIPCHRILEILDGDGIKNEMNTREIAIQTDYYDAIMEGSSPCAVPPHNEQLATAVMSAPALCDTSSAGLPDIKEITKPTGTNPTYDFDDIKG